MKSKRKESNHSNETITNDKTMWQSRAITVESITIATRDIFTLIIEVDKVMRSYHLPSLQFVSDALSCKTRQEQVDIIIDAMQQIKERIVNLRE